MLSVIVLFLASLSLVLTVTAEPSLLDIVRTDPELSILASIIAKTGNGVANPGMTHDTKWLLKILTIFETSINVSTRMAATNLSCLWRRPTRSVFLGSHHQKLSLTFPGIFPHLETGHGSTFRSIELPPFTLTLAPPFY